MTHRKPSEHEEHNCCTCLPGTHGQACCNQGHPVRPIRYVVTGLQPVLGVAPGQTVNADPDAAQTRRLVRSGHLKPAPTRQPAADNEPKE